MEFIRAVGRAYHQAFAGLPREVWYLALVMLINRSGSMVLPFLALYCNAELGFEASASGMMVVAYGLGSTVGTLIGGMLTQRFGATRVQIASLVLNGLGFFALSQMRSYEAFATTLFLSSIAADAMRPANGTAITQVCPTELHKRAFGLNRLAINLGLTIGPAIGGILASFSYQWLFWIDGLTCIVAALVLWRIFASRRLEQAATETKETKTSRSPWTDPVFLVFIALAIPSFGMFFQIISTYPLFLRDEYRFQEWQIGLLFALNTFVVVFFEMLIVTHMNGWRPLRVIAWGSFFMCEGFAILCLGNGVGLAILSVLGYTLGEMLAMPQGMAFVALRSGEESRSRYIGAYTTCISLSFVIGPIIGAWIYSFDHWLFWRIGLGLGLAVLVGYYALDYFAQSANSPRGQPADAV